MLMKTLMLTIALVATLLTAMIARAEEAPAAALTGTVAVVADEAGAVTGVTLAVGDKVYTVAFDENGKALAALKGKQVKVTGKVVEADGKATITVATSEEVK
jgi:tripartite-type tricarboxylate transporter receptor subunit TctC